MTDHIFGLKEGDELSIKGPIPKFEYKANQVGLAVISSPNVADLIDSSNRLD